jgi:hypothetical protein
MRSRESRLWSRGLHSASFDDRSRAEPQGDSLESVIGRSRFSFQGFEAAQHQEQLDVAAWERDVAPCNAGMRRAARIAQKPKKETPSAR